MEIVVTENHLAAIGHADTVLAYMAVSNFAATDWANDFNVEVFFVSHVITFRVNDCCCVVPSLYHIHRHLSRGILTNSHKFLGFL